MKLYFIILFIMALFISKLNALETITDVKKARVIVNQARAAKKALEAQKKGQQELGGPLPQSEYQLIYSESLPYEKDCQNCPSHLKLSSQIQHILSESKSEDGATPLSDQLLVDKLKLLHLSLLASKQAQELAQNCKSDASAKSADLKREVTPFLDKQMQLMAQETFRFSSVQAINVFDPTTKQNISYYRNDHIITEIRNDPSSGTTLVRYFSVPVKDKQAPKENGVSIGWDVEKKYRDVHIVRAYGELPITPKGVSIVGQSDTSLAKGNRAQIELLDKGEKIVSVDLHTNLDGKTDHVISIPYSISMPILGGRVYGDAQSGTKEESVRLTLTGNDRDYLKSEFRRTSGGQESWYVAHELQPIPATLTAGKDNEKRYMSLQKKMSFGKKLTTVLTVKVEEGSGTTVTYQAEYPL